MKERKIKVNVNTLSDLTKLTKGTRTAIIRQLSEEQIYTLMLECDNCINKIASENKDINKDKISTSKDSDIRTYGPGIMANVKSNATAKDGYAYGYTKKECTTSRYIILFYLNEKWYLVGYSSSSSTKTINGITLFVNFSSNSDQLATNNAESPVSCSHRNGFRPFRKNRCSYQRCCYLNRTCSRSR